MTLSGQWETRISARGNTYRVWRRDLPVPLIPQHYLDCSIYLYASRQSAEDGEHFGGSGCLVRVESNPVYDPSSFKNGRYTKVSLFFPPHIYAVTNEHVARNGFPVIRLNTTDGKTDILELAHNDWIPHPDGDDLAIAPIDLPTSRYNYVPIPIELFAHRGTFASEIGMGDDTFMVGRFITHEGKQRNTPSLRFGSIAMLPFEKVKLANGYMQEAFLVETRSLSGYSGSPVFLYRPATHEMFVPPDHSYSISFDRRESITNLVDHPILLGIDCGHIRRYKKVLDARLNPHPQGWRVESNTGMAIVIPAWRLSDFLEGNDLLMQRKRKDREWQKEKEAEAERSSVALDSEQPDVFTRESFTDALKRSSRKTSEPESKEKTSN